METHLADWDGVQAKTWSGEAERTILDPEYRMYCNPYFQSFLFYADNTIFETNELFEVIAQHPLNNFPYLANEYPFGPAYRYTTFYFEGRVMGEVLDRVYEFTETKVFELTRLPLEICEESDTYGRVAPIGGAISLLTNGQLMVARPPEFTFRVTELPFPVERNFGFIRTSVLYSQDRFCQCYLQDGKLIFGQAMEVRTDFLCCSGGLLFVEKDEIFYVIDVQNLKITEGPESHVRDYDDVVKLYTCGILPGTFLKLTRFHVENFETKFSRWRKTVDDDRRCFEVKKYDREPVQKLIVHEPAEFAPLVDLGTQTEDSECISLETVLSTLSVEDDLLNGPILELKFNGTILNFKCQLTEEHHFFYKEKQRNRQGDPVDKTTLKALESLTALAKK